MKETLVKLERSPGRVLDFAVLVYCTGICVLNYDLLCKCMCLCAVCAWADAVMLILVSLSFGLVSYPITSRTKIGLEK